MHHHGNVQHHSAMSQSSHGHAGHHHGHGLIGIGGSGSLVDMHGLDLDSIGKINSGNNNNGVAG